MKRTIYIVCFVAFILTFLSINVLVFGETQGPIYGALSVKNGVLCGQDGKPAQLVGFSSHGLQWHPGFINDKSVSFMKNNWNVTVVRAAMYTATDWWVNGYCSNPSIEYEVDRAVDAAVNNGIYVVIDWHILSDYDPWFNIGKAEDFFRRQAQKHGNKPNVIFEICNEPNKVNWDNSIKPYAERIVPIIRQYSNNIIIIGTPDWCQGIDKAMYDRVSGNNLMYALHFYAGEDSHERLKDVLKQTQEAKDRLPVFVTEFGTTNAAGNYNVNEANTKVWLDILKQYDISWCNWSLSNKGEPCSALQGWTSPWNFDNNNLTQSGWIIVNYLKANYGRSFVANSPEPGLDDWGINQSVLVGGNDETSNFGLKQSVKIGFSPEEYISSEYYDLQDTSNAEVASKNFDEELDKASKEEEPSLISRAYNKISSYFK